MNFLAPPTIFPFFFFNDTATTEIYTLSLHDALPICDQPGRIVERPLPLITRESTLGRSARPPRHRKADVATRGPVWARSEEHTSELQSHLNLVCRLLLEKKNHVRPYQSYPLAAHYTH